VRLGFTDHDNPLQIDGTTCEAGSGLESGNIEASLGLNINGVEIAGALQSAAISNRDIETGKLDGARVETYLVNWAEPDQFMMEQSYLVGEITREDGTFKAELRSLTTLMDHSQGRHFVKHCQAELGDGKCGVDTGLPAFTKPAIVTAAKSPVVLEVSGLANDPGGWFRAGVIEWTTGANTGLRIEVAEHYPEQGRVYLHLWIPMPEPVSTGDNFTITTGCDKSFKTCRQKFSNEINFRGFPHMPGNDFAGSYAGISRNMDGGALIK